MFAMLVLRFADRLLVRVTLLLILRARALIDAALLLILETMVLFPVVRLLMFKVLVLISPIAEFIAALLDDMWLEILKELVLMAAL